MLRELRGLLSTYFERLAAYQAGTLLTFLYWTVIAATALGMRLFGRRLLPDTYGKAASHWIARTTVARDPDSILRQY